MNSLTLSRNAHECTIYSADACILLNSIDPSYPKHSPVSHMIRNYRRAWSTPGRQGARMTCAPKGVWNLFGCGPLTMAKAVDDLYTMSEYERANNQMWHSLDPHKTIWKEDGTVSDSFYSY